MDGTRLRSRVHVLASAFGSTVSVSADHPYSVFFESVLDLMTFSSVWSRLSSHLSRPSGTRVGLPNHECDNNGRGTSPLPGTHPPSSSTITDPSIRVVNQSVDTREVTSLSL